MVYKTTEEYQAQYLCYKMQDAALKPNVTLKKYNPTRNPDILQVPDTVDWRTKNAVTEVKNQARKNKNCMKCYSFLLYFLWTITTIY